MKRLFKRIAGTSETGRERGSLRRRLGRRARSEDDGRSTRLDRMLKWGIGITLVVLATLLFPARQAFKYNLNEGQITAEAIVSPITFSIYKNDDELSRQREDARMSVPPVLEFRPLIRDRQIGLLDSLFTKLRDIAATAASDSALVVAFQRVAPEVSRESVLFLLGREVRNRTANRRQSLSDDRIARLRTALSESLTGYFGLGVVESRTGLIEISRGTVTVIKDSTESVQLLDTMVDLATARNDLPTRIQERLEGTDDSLVKAGYEIARILLVPNLPLDAGRTDLRRREAANNVALTKGTVLQNEEIIGANKRVTLEALEKVRSLERALAESELQNGWWPIARSWLARFFLIALLFSIYIAFLIYHRPQMLAETRILATLAVLFAAELTIAFLLRETGSLSIYLVPVAVATMLLTVLFDTGIGLVTAFSIGLLLGAVMGMDYPVAFIHSVAGGAGVYAVRRVAKRSHFYRALWVLPLAYTIGIAGLELLRFSSSAELASAVGYGALNGILSVVMTIGLLPLFESIFHFTTDISLLELSDLNHPLLRQLAIRAPGTYHHSLMMGELGAAAAEACGANPLLTRVGAYFHDIGKMNKPEYFVENQTGRNPHQRLSPHMSALIVSSHVKEGVELADQYRLPNKIKAFIPEHHGTMIMSFFYLKAVEAADGGVKVSEDEFRYPGPRPQSRETGIVMLADAVEAASRVLSDPSPSRVRGLVSDLVTNRMEEGELDECPLTIRDLRQVKEAFIGFLTSRFHQRIEYPDKEDTLRKAADRDTARRKARTGTATEDVLPIGEMSLPPELEAELPAGSARPLTDRDDP